MDPISDMFIRIKNAQKAGHETVQFPYSKFKHEIIKTLERAGFVGKGERRGKRVRKMLEVALLYRGEEPVVSNVKLLSRPSRRIYTPYQGIRRARHGGVIILSTPKGVLTEREARKEKAGGELIVELW